MTNQFADTIYKNGKIYTVNPAQPWAQAVAIKAGRFVAVGSNYDVEVWIGSKTEVIDLEGGFVMPGIYDMHQHPDLALVPEMMGQFNVPEMATPEQIKQMVLEHAENNPGDGWIVAHGWEPPPFMEADVEPGMAWLDSFIPDRPVFLVDRSRVYNMFNSRAAELVGISKETRDPRHGYFKRDPITGDLAGLVIDGAQAPFWTALPPVSQAVYEEAYERAVKMLAANGVVGVKFSHMNVSMIEAVHQLDEDGKLTLRCETHLSWKDDIGPVTGRWDYIAGQRLMYRSEYVNPNGVKFHFDGVTPARSGYMLQPYRDSDERGTINLRPAEIKDVVAYLDKIGIRVDAHCIGDAAVRLFLDAVEHARQVNGPNGPRHQSTHTTWVHPEDRARFKELNVIPEFSPIFWFPSPASVGLKTLLNDDQVASVFPIAEVLAAGGRGVIGTDWPVTPLNFTWVGLEALVTRANPWGDLPGTWGTPIPLEQAIQMLTLNGAWAMELENETGSIETGKSADFIVLDRNLFEIPANDIHNSKVLGTVFMGKPVYIEDEVRQELEARGQLLTQSLAFP